MQAWEGPVVEAPFLWEQDGLFYLFYSANTCASVTHYGHRMTPASTSHACWLCACALMSTCRKELNRCQTRIRSRQSWCADPDVRWLAFAAGGEQPIQLHCALVVELWHQPSILSAGMRLPTTP